jgi:hypothetical protein
MRTSYTDSTYHQNLLSTRIFGDETGGYVFYLHSLKQIIRPVTLQLNFCKHMLWIYSRKAEGACPLYTWQLVWTYEVGGSVITYAVNRRSITAFRRREHSHAWDVTCLLAATRIRTWCLVTNIATFSDKLTSVVFRWKYQRMIIAYQNSIHTYLWRQYTKTSVSHSILHEARYRLQNNEGIWRGKGAEPPIPKLSASEVSG